MVGIVTARGGSKGIPGKNVRLLAGKPLIVWTIEAALESGSFDRLIVSTDSEEIAQVCRDHGAEAPFLRPPELATDTAGSLEVVEHALDWLSRDEGRAPNSLMLLQPTSPLRTARDIQGASGLFETGAADAVVSVTPSTPHPYLAKRLAEDGFLAPMFDDLPSTIRRQDLPECVTANGAIYAIRSDALIRDRSFIPRRTLPYPMPGERSIDVDELWQFDVAESLLRIRLAGR